MATKDPPDEELKSAKGSPTFRLTGKPLIDPEKSKYLYHPEPKGQKPKNYAAAEKDAPNRDKPTTADAKKGLKDLPSAMAAVDPQGLSSIAPMMYQMLGQIASASKGTSQSSRKTVIEDALTGALSILANTYTFDYLTLVFDNALGNGGIDLIDAEYQDIVKNAIAKLYTNYIAYGEQNLPVTTYPVVTEIGTAPTPVVTVVPDLYMQQYYTLQNDPYPGYIKWVSQDGTDFVFTQRKIGEPYYASPDEEIYSVAEQELAKRLEPFVIANNLTAYELNNSLVEQNTNVENNTQEKTGGKNSAQKAVEILTQLAGYAGQITNLQQKLQLPLSILNQGGIKKSQEAFMKNIGLIKQEKEKAKKAAQPLGAAAALGSLTGALGSVSGALGSVSGALGSVSGAISSISSVAGAVSSISSVTDIASAAQRVSSLSSSAKNLYDTIKS